jgi:hypothetical protein
MLGTNSLVSSEPYLFAIFRSFLEGFLYLQPSEIFLGVPYADGWSMVSGAPKNQSSFGGAHKYFLFFYSTADVIIFWQETFITILQ